MCHIQDESKEEIAYAQDMFETIFKDYALKTYNKDVGEKAAEYVAQGVNDVVAAAVALMAVSALGMAVLARKK